MPQIRPQRSNNRFFLADKIVHNEAQFLVRNRQNDHAKPIVILRGSFVVKYTSDPAKRYHLVSNAYDFSLLTAMHTFSFHSQYLYHRSKRQSIRIAARFDD